MTHTQTDVLIHIKETLPLEFMQEVSESLLEMDGVVTADISVAEHMLKVVYESETITGRCIIDDIKSVGLHASLVGL